GGAMSTRMLRLIAVTAALPLSGCACHSTESTQVGVVTRKFALGGLLGKPGVQEEVYNPGATYIFTPFTTDWDTFDVSLQNLAMVRDPGKGDRQGEDDVQFKTVDGNDIRVDVTVAWQIDRTRAPHLLVHVGSNTEQVKDKLVRPACRAIVRDILNELNSEEFYVSDKRFEKASKAQARLAEFLGPEGVIVQQVILGEHHFNPEYEKVIQEKKLAEQNAERLRSEARAAAEQAKSNLERAKGTVAQQMAQANGALEQAKLNADADFFRSQKQAEAILAEKKARAKGIQKQNEAMSGSGGKTMVKLRLAEALEGKQLIFVPAGKGGVGLQTLNLNQLIGAYAAGQVLQEPATPAPAP
ncbi:MAG TPA: SPFH domain-containing protein, partial [Myxococcaceae bacterium]|nr:SPFH domain-containing protein [Myxococcaceae bacterium]